MKPIKNLILTGASRFESYLVSSTRVQFVVTATSSILICLLVGGLHFYQRASYQQQTNLTRSFREARLDLMMGVMHVENSRQVSSPFEFGQGKALIRQAISNFEIATNRSSLSVLRSGIEQVEQFRREALELEAELMKPSSTPEDFSQRLVALRVKFHSLTNLAEEVDQDLQNEMQKSVRTSSQVFLIVMFCSIVLLSVILLLVLIANNKVRSSDKAMLAAQQEIRKTLELLYAVVDGTPDLVFVKGADSTYILANRALAEFASCELSGFVGASDNRFYGGEISEQFAMHDAEVMQSKLPISYEATINHHSMEKTFSIAKAPYVGTNGEVLGVIGICRDVTLNLHSQRMEIVGRLAGGIAHDFNNILTVINGYAELMLSAPKLPDVLRPAVQSIHSAGERASSLTSQLLSFSRKAIIAPKVVNLNEAIRNSTCLLSRLISEDIRLSTQLCSSAPYVKIDPNQLDQVLMNLVVNAKDAMPGGGEIVIGTHINSGSRVDCIELDPTFEAETAEITVRDTGSGVSKEVLKHIFEPFFTTKSPGRGTGLGLAVVHSVIEHAGGIVTVESEENLGTVFRIRLPCVGATNLEAAENAVDIPPLGRETILLVEDEESVGNLCEFILTRQGYRVIRAASGEEGFELFEQHRKVIDLLITDVILPGISGHQLAEKIWGKSKDRPVVFMSGYADNDVLRYGVSEATEMFLQKPFTPDRLIRKVQACLEAVRLNSNSHQSLNSENSPNCTAQNQCL